MPCVQSSDSRERPGCVCRQSAFKSYNCEINGSVLGTALSSFALACKTSSGIGQAGGYCQVGLGFRV